MTAVRAATRWHEWRRQRGSLADTVDEYDGLRKNNSDCSWSSSKIFWNSETGTKLAAHGLFVTSDKLGV